MTDHRSDPFLVAWMAAQRPPLARHPHAAARIEHAALHHVIDAIDGELEVLCARRRAALAGLRRIRPKLWPESLQRHRRRPAEVDDVPIPPAPPDAVPVAGVDLRAVCVGILRRHGRCALRELHGLIHRYGYVLDSPRPVQRLADAMAYEVRQGRCRRVERGVYAAVGEDEPAPPPSSLPVEPLPWTDPDPERPQLDPVTIDDPERWSGRAWPPAFPEGCERPDGRDALLARSSPGTGRWRPRRRYPDSTLDEDVHRARERVAALVRQPTAPCPAPDAHPDPGEPAGASPTPPPDPYPARWERFVDESFPTVRRWAQRRREWYRSQRRRERIGWPEHTGDDPPAGGRPG